MSRSLTQTQRGELHAVGVETEWLQLVTITHADLAAPIRIVDRRADIVSRSNTFTAWPFSIEQPEEDQDSLPTATLRVDVIDRTILSQLRALDSAPVVTLEVIRDVAPDTVIAGPWEFKVGSAAVDPVGATLQLLPEDTLDEPYPGHTYTPESFPGLFT